MGNQVLFFIIEYYCMLYIIHIYIYKAQTELNYLYRQTQQQTGLAFVLTIEEGYILYRREGKGRRCCLGDRLHR